MDEPSLDEPSQEKLKAAEAAMERSSANEDRPMEAEIPDDRTREMRTPGFARMRLDWHDKDATVMMSVLQYADDRVAVNFTDAYKIMNDIYGIVRQHKASRDTGELLYDRHGFPVWETTESGRYIEDYSRLGIKEREQFMFQIIGCMFAWEQAAADAWGQAMFAKAQWEEKFADTFLDTSEGGRKTDEAMTQRARGKSREERYFALFQSLYSRKADALVRSMDRIQQRLKDSLYTR
jgi:hypothetical protein